MTTSNRSLRRLIFGCGYLGARVARRWRAGGDSVSVVTRSAQRAAALRHEGFQTIVADVSDPKTLRALPAADSVLYAVGFDRSQGASIHEVYVDGLQHVLDALPEATGPIVFVSSSGVYGQNDGRWVDEDSPCEPAREGGRACLAAEHVLRSHPRGHHATILRLAGLYGPGRIPRADDLRAGKPIPAPRHGFLNLIHVDDAADVVIAAADPGKPHRDQDVRIFVVSDGSPVLRSDYFEEVARCVGAPSPQFIDPTPGSGRHQRGTSSKRLRNTRMLKAMDIVLHYPSYLEGLARELAIDGIPSRTVRSTGFSRNLPADDSG